MAASCLLLKSLQDNTVISLVYILVGILTWQHTSIILWKRGHIKHAALKVAFYVQVHLFHSFQQEES